MDVMGTSLDDKDAAIRMIGKMWGTGSSFKSQILRTVSAPRVKRLMASYFGLSNRSSESEHRKKGELWGFQ